MMLSTVEISTPKNSAPSSKTTIWFSILVRSF